MLNQLFEKKTTVNVDCVSWSSASDLLAVAYERGYVTIHNTNWHQLWALEAPRENAKVINMSWRPDGRVLAIAYNIHEIHIVEIEYKEIVVKLEAPVTYLKWAEEAFIHRYTEYQKNNDDYTPKQVPLPPTNDEVAADEFRKLSSQKGINFLMVGTSTGLLKFYVYGMYFCFSIDILKLLKEEAEKCEILYSDFSDDLKTIAVIINVNDRLKCLLVDSNQLSDRAQHLYDITYRRAGFEINLDYLERTINYIVGAWEKILSSEADLKLTKHSNDVSTDYLELLIRGFCPPHLQRFLTRELSESRLQEVGRSIESLHNIMHKLLLYPLQLAIENVIDDLTIFQGIHKAANSDNQFYMNVDESLIEECLVAAGGYCIKSSEMLSIIDASMSKYKYFLRWLCTVINKLNNDKKISYDEFSRHERDLITQFICEMDENSKIAAMKSVVSLYLHDDGLFDTQCNGNYPSLNLLKENPTLENCLLIMPSTFQNMSLMSLHKYLKNCSAKIFENYNHFINDFLSLNCWTLSDFISKVSAIKHCNDVRLLVAFTRTTENGMYANIARISNAHSQIETISLYFNSEEYNQLYVNDLQFYTNDVLSILLSGKNLSFYFHLPTCELSKGSSGKESIKNGFSLVPKLEHRLKIVDNMKASSFVVNGSLHLVMVITADRRHLRIYSTETNGNEKCIGIRYENTSKEVIAPDSSYGYHTIGNAKEPIVPVKEYSANLNYFASLNYSPEEECVNMNSIEFNNLHIS